jgi:acyl dehydratase
MLISVSRCELEGEHRILGAGHQAARPPPAMLASTHVSTAADDTRGGDDMEVTSALVDEIRAQIGDTEEPITAVIDPMLSRRYARSIGETNPIYLDEAAAIAHGYPGLVVPPNFLPSYLDWTDGGPEDELRPDGTPLDEMKWLPSEGLRIMGGGEEMVFHEPLIAGTEVTLTSALHDVESRESKGKLMVILKIRNTYTAADGTVLMTATRTVLGR